MTGGEPDKRERGRECERRKANGKRGLERDQGAEYYESLTIETGLY